MKALLWISLALPGIPAAGAFDWKAHLKSIVEINSATENLAGTAAVLEAMRSELEALGARVAMHATGEGHRLLSADFGEGTPRLLLVGHADTVFPDDETKRGFSEEETRILGPGVIDMKGGLTLLVDALASLPPQGRSGIRVLINDDEEIGSPFSHPKLIELGKGVRSALVLEPGLENGEVVTSHSGVLWFDLETTGRASHAGLAPRDGINACVELSHLVARVSTLTRHEKNLTFNAGVISGGTKPNVVCEKASARFDVRYVDPKDLDRAMKQVRKWIALPSVRMKDGLPRTRLIEGVSVVSMPPHVSKRILGVASRLAGKQGLRLKGAHVGYASDANRLWASGTEILVGLGPYGGRMHSEGEFMLKESYERRRKLLVELIPALLSD